LLAVPASATQLFTNNSVTLGGTVNGSGISAGPWTAELFASAGQCLHLNVTQQNRDLEMVVVAPNGAVYRNDDRGGERCPLCPQVKINSTPNNGWYTVSISEWTGASVQANFQLLYQRTGTGSAVCLPETTPVAATAATPGVTKGGASSPSSGPNAPNN
jgi:hypothetical protein